ncbi:MAG: hypothetical protein AAB576_07115, partial [Elusimicrobiota bacterium]
DDAYYIIGARSLLQGSFSFLNRPQAPPILQYWPGYPLLLAPWAALFPGSLPALQASSLLFTLGSLLLLASSFAARLSPPGSAFLLFLCAFNPLTLAYCGSVMAEPAYLLLSLWAFKLSESWSGRFTLGKSVFFGLLLGFCILVRPMGLALACAFILSRLREGDKRRAFLWAALSAAAAGAWWLRNSLLSGGFPQAAEWAGMFGLSGGPAGGLAKNLLRNAAFYASAPGELSFPPPFSPGSWRTFYSDAAAGLFWFGALAGLARCLREEGPGVLPLYLGFYAGMLLLWIHPDIRYLLPILPLLLWLYLKGLDSLASTLRVNLRAFALLPCLLIAAEAFSLAGKVSAPNRYNTPALRSYQRLRELVPADATILCSMAGRVHLYTGRSTEEFPHLPDPSGFMAHLRRLRVSHVLLTREDFLESPGINAWDKARAQAAPYLEDPGLFRVVYDDPGEEARIFELIRPREGR